MKFPVTDIDKRQAFAMGDRKCYFKYPFSCQATELEALPNYQLFTLFHEFITIVRDGLDWKSTTIFKRYFNQKTFPKFIHFSGHSETMAPLLAAFGKYGYTMHRPRAGSALFLEFYRENGQIWVHIYYKEEVGKETVIDTMTVEEFETFVIQKTEFYDIYGKVKGDVISAC